MRLRVVSVNIHKGVASLRPRLVLAALRDNLQLLSPNIVLLQEVMGNSHAFRRRYRDHPSGSQFEYLADTMWPYMAYGQNAVTQQGDHGNAILSEFPVRHHVNVDISTMPGRESRGLLMAHIPLPDKSHVSIGSVHLGLRKRERNRQLNLMAAYLRHGRWPDSTSLVDEALLIGGDFNDWRGTETQEFELGCNLDEAYRCVEGRYARSFPAWLPVLPLDRIYTRKLHVLDAFRTGGRWRSLSDHQAMVVDIETVQGTYGNR